MSFAETCEDPIAWVHRARLAPFFLFTHSKKHFLTIQYPGTDGQGKFAMIHRPVRCLCPVVAAAEAETGKKVERAEEK